MTTITRRAAISAALATAAAPAAIAAPSAEPREPDAELLELCRRFEEIAMRLNESYNHYQEINAALEPTKPPRPEVTRIRHEDDGLCLPVPQRQYAREFWEFCDCKRLEEGWIDPSVHRRPESRERAFEIVTALNKWHELYRAHFAAVFAEEELQGTLMDRLKELEMPLAKCRATTIEGIQARARCIGWWHQNSFELHDENKAMVTATIRDVVALAGPMPLDHGSELDRAANRI